MLCKRRIFAVAFRGAFFDSRERIDIYIHWIYSNRMEMPTTVSEIISGADKSSSTQ